MSDGDNMLACSGYFLGRFWPHLTGARDVEGANGAKSTAATNVSTGGIFAKGICVWDTYNNIGLSVLVFWLSIDMLLIK